MLVQAKLNYKPVVLTVKEIRLDPVPNTFNSGHTCKYSSNNFIKNKTSKTFKII